MTAPTCSTPEEIPAVWRRRVAEIDGLMRVRRGRHPQYRQAEEQAGKLHQLLESEQLSTRLLHAVRNSDPRSP